MHRPVTYETLDAMTAEIRVSGLKGGHSGAEIHVGYANANILLARVLKEMEKHIDFSLAHISGGTMDNAITRDSKCIIYLRSDADALYKLALKMQTELRKEFVAVDPSICVKVNQTDFSGEAFSKESGSNLIKLLNSLPNGVIKMSESIKGLVQISLNLGVVKTIESGVSLTFSVRSSVDAEKDELISNLKEISVNGGASANAHSEYPAWPYKEDSVLRDKMADIYKEMFGKEMTVTAIHAGLECGLFCGKIEGLDCVSLGPDMFDIHSPSERLSISSTERVWNYLLQVLKRL
jgi:dipeptidase D